MQETGVLSLGQEDPLEEEMAIHSSILAGEFHGQRSLVGYSPWDRKELDMIEQLTHTQFGKNNFTSLPHFLFRWEAVRCLCFISQASERKPES